VSVAAITPCVTSQRIFIVVSVYFVIDSVRKLLDTPPYTYVLEENLKRKDNLGDLGVNWRKILKRVFEKYGVNCTGLSWL
jgi:hypothetical protein